MKSLESRLTEHPFLKGFSADHLKTLVQYAMPVQFESGEVLFREGDLANRFYLICSGRVELTTEHNELVQRVDTIGAGDALGWSWLFPPYYWNFDATAREPVNAIFFYGTRLREKCESDPVLGYRLMRATAEIVIQRLQATRRRLVEANVQSGSRTSCTVVEGIN